jgi:TP901 family phage tail tape measure protein
MADTQSNIQVNIDTTQALASIKNLQRQISAFHSSMAKGGAAANAVSAQFQQTLINSINSTGKFAAEIRTIKTTTESFTSSLEKNKFSLGEYFRYAGGASKTFGRLFKTEFDTINKVARENVKDLQTQYIRLGRDASGAMKSIAVRPLSLDMTDLGTRTQVAAQKQAILNQLLKQGSTNLLNFGKNTQWAGRQLMVGFTLPLIAVGSAASKTFMDMETQAIRFKKVYGDLFTPTGESQQALKDIQELGKEFTKYGIAVSSTVSLAAEAAAAGFKGVDLTRQTTAATRLSILGQVESQKALETTIALQNAFSMSSENLAESIDFLNAVENQTVLSLDDVSTAIPKAAPIIQQLGGDVKDLAFFMTAMKEGGINASEGANAIKSGLASMINPTGKANAMLESFGINVKKIVVDNKGDLKKTVVEFATALNQLDPLNRAQAIEQMFGKFQFARLSTLFANVTKEGTQASRVLDLAGSSVQQLAALSEKELGMTSESAMNKFKGAVESLKLSLIPLGEEFLKAVTPIAEFITRILDKFNNLSDTTKKIIVTITAVVAGLGPVFLMTFGLLANGLANIIKGFTFLKTLFNKTGAATSTLGTQVQYMTTEQRNAAAVAASLDQVHVKLAQTFTSEASAVNALTQAYQRAVAAQSQFVPVGPPITRGPIAKLAGGKPATVGGTGNQDSELALLMPGETVIPKAMSAKYASLINAMISDSVPGYEVGKPKLGATELPIYPEHAIRLQPAAENMAGRAGTTNTPSVLSPLALRIGEARGISPTSSQISSGRFDGIYREYEQITSQFVERLNTEYNTTFADIKDENERMRKSWSAAGKAVEKQVDSIAAPKERAVVRRTFGLDEDVYGTIPTDSREAGGTAPNRSRRGAFKSRLTGLRSYTRIRPGAKKLFERMTGKSAADLQMGHVFPPRAVDISTLESDPKKSGSVATARAVMERGKKDGEAYDRGVKKGTRDIYEASRDRRSPHPQAAKDGTDDARAYAAARDKELRKQSGRARRVATRAQGPAAIGATPQPGSTILPIVPGGRNNTPNTPPNTPLTPTRSSAIGSMAKSVGGRVNSFGGGMGLLGLNMGLSMAPDFAGKGLLQGAMTGANLGMILGPYGMAAGAAIGFVTSAYNGLINKQKEHAAITKSTFTISNNLITAFGDKVLSTEVKVTELSKASLSLRDAFGILSPEIQTIIDDLKKLPEDDPLAILIGKISKKDQSLREVTGNIRANAATAIAMGGLSPENAKKYIYTLLAAAGKANEFGAVWQSVSKDVISTTTATTAIFSKLGDAVSKTGGQWVFYQGQLGGATKEYKDLNSTAQALSDQMFTLFGVLSNGAFTYDQIQERLKALDASSLDAATGLLALKAAVNATGDAALIERFALIESIIKESGQAATRTASDYTMMHLALEMLAAQGKNLDTLRTDLFPDEGQRALARRYATDLMLLDSLIKGKNFKTYVDGLAKQREELNKIFDDYQDPEDGVNGLSKASEAYLKVLDAEIKGLEAKRDAQKNVNDESQRHIDLQMKMKGLANEVVLAKISGDYIKAASLEQQAQNLQMEFDQDTEIRIKDAEIARLKARAEEIRGGASLARSEINKIPKKEKVDKVRKASGGMIRGAGTPTSDSIPALLSNGEYVVKAKSVKKYGVSVLDALNAGRFAEGGSVSNQLSLFPWSPKLPNYLNGKPTGDPRTGRWGELRYNPSKGHDIWGGTEIPGLKFTGKTPQQSDYWHQMQEQPNKLFGSGMGINKDPMRYAGSGASMGGMGMGAYGLGPLMFAKGGMIPGYAGGGIVGTILGSVGKLISKLFVGKQAGKAIKPNQVEKFLSDALGDVPLPKIKKEELPAGVGGQYIPRFSDKSSNYENLLPHILFNSKYKVQGNTAIHETMHHFDMDVLHDSFRKTIAKLRVDGKKDLADEYESLFVTAENKQKGMGLATWEDRAITLEDYDSLTYFGGAAEAFADESTFKAYTKFMSSKKIKDKKLALKIGNPYGPGFGNLRGYFSSYAQFENNALNMPMRLNPSFLRGLVENSPNMPQATKDIYLAWAEGLQRFKPPARTNPDEIRNSLQWQNFKKYITDNGLDKAKGFHDGGPVGHKHPSTSYNPAAMSASAKEIMALRTKLIKSGYANSEYVPRPAELTSGSSPFNISSSAGSTASLFLPATGIAGDPRFIADSQEATSFSRQLGDMFNFAMTPLTPSKAPDVNKQTEKSKYMREQMAVAWDMMHKVNPAFKLGSWLVKPMFDAATNIGAGDGKWNDYTSIAAMFAGSGVYKSTASAAITGVKSLAGAAKGASASAKAAKLRAEFEAIKASGKLLTPEGNAARLDIAHYEALMAAKLNNFTPLMDLRSASSKQLIAENQALPSRIEEPFTMGDKSFIYRFTKHPLNEADAPVIDDFLASIKDPRSGLGRESVSPYRSPRNQVEVIDPLTGKTVASITYDAITGAIGYRYTDKSVQNQGLSTFLYNKAAQITRIRHSAMLSETGGRASAPKIGGFMADDPIYDLPGMASLSGKPTLPGLPSLSGLPGITSLKTTVQKIIKGIKKPKKPTKSNEPDSVFETRMKGITNSIIGAQNDRMLLYSPELREGLRPETIAWFENSYRTSKNFPYGNNGYVEPGALAELQRIKDLETAAASRAAAASSASPFDRVKIWRNNENRTYSSYPLFNQGSGSYILPDDLFDLQRLMSAPDVPAGFPWAANQESYRFMRPFDRGDLTPRGATGGYLDKGKLRIPKFANGGLIKGPGTGISDSIQAGFGYAGGGSIRVSNGEYVVKASSVRDYGVKTMDAINNGTATVGANSGGTVYNINMPVTSNNANPEIVANEVMRKLKLEVSKNNKTNKVGL